ncbi:MAG: DUF4384 domain-containing protein [Hyphomicrobiales bacterium]
MRCLILWSRSRPPAALVIIVSLCLVPQLYAQASPSDSGVLHFLFAVGAQLAKPGSPKPVPVQTHTVLNSGDRIRFFLEPKSDVYFYLFHLGPQGDLSLLFPPDLKKPQRLPGPHFYVPEEPLWFELDATRGTEKFFFLASKSQLRQLENLYARHITFKEQPDIQSSTQAILNEISSLSKQRRPLTAPAERPVRIAGKQRGAQETDAAAPSDITSFAKEIVAQGFFSKTFTIDHR